MRAASGLVLATGPVAHEVRWLSWWHLWSTLAALAGLLGLTCLEAPWWCRLPASLLAGLTLVRLFALYHDHQHGTILRGSALADVLLGVYGLLLLTPPSVWRYAHHYHHRHNARLHAAGIGSFPLMTTRDYARASRWRRFTYALSRHPLTILAGYATVFLYGMCLYPLLVRPRQHADAALALGLHAALAAALALFAPALLLWTFLLPLLVATALGSYLFYAQHNFPGARFQEGGAWDFAAAALAGSKIGRA